MAEGQEIPKSPAEIMHVLRDQIDAAPNAEKRLELKGLLGDLEKQHGKYPDASLLPKQIEELRGRLDGANAEARLDIQARLTDMEGHLKSTASSASAQVPPTGASATHKVEPASVAEHYEESMKRGFNPTASGTETPAGGVRAKVDGFIAGIKEALNLGKKGEVAAGVGADKVSELNILKDQLKIAEEAKVDTASIKESIGKVSEEVSKIKNEAWDKSFTSMFEGAAARAGGNWAKAGKGELAIRGTGVVVGVGGLISAGKDVFAPERDENGQRKKSWVKTGLKAVGSAALVVASVIAGGKNRAMNLG